MDMDTKKTIKICGRILTDINEDVRIADIKFI